jgi:hypothetical protein
MAMPYSVTVNLDLAEARMHVKTWMNKSPGWVLTSTEENALSFNRTIKPSGAAVLVLLLLGIIPGLLYLAAGAKNETRNVYFKVLGKKKTAISLEAGTSTSEYAKSLARYLAQVDPALSAPPVPPSPTATIDRFALRLFLAVAVLVVVGLFLAAVLG